jgi:hypothetical protein
MKYKHKINHRKPNYYSDGKYYLIQCWNCNNNVQNKNPESGVCEHCNWSFHYAEKRR